MNRLNFLSVCLLAFATIFGAPVRGAEFGRVEGKFDVRPTGAAGYRIPIWTPDGPQGLQPDLALQYDSQVRFANAGIGWALTGISSVERCPGSEISYGIQEVTFTMADHFCMNGNRLRLTSAAGTHGQPLSTYQLRLQQFLSVTAYSSAGNGPAYFIAKGKDGWTYEYGSTTDSRVFPGPKPTQGATPLRWMVSRITDRNGNSMTYSYDNDLGTAVPTKIQWAPTSHGASTYLYSADFSWTTDVSSSVFRGFVGSYAIIDNKRLTAISVHHSGALVRKYVLGYATGPSSNASRLSSLKECSDSAGNNCLLPTNFSYQDGTSGLAQGTGSTPTGSGAATTRARDFNGDGKHDLLYKNGGNWLVAFANSSGFGSPVDTGFSSTSYLAGKFAPNGGDSFIVNVSGALTSYRYNGSTFTSASVGVSHPSGTLPTPIDINGDELLDFAWPSGLHIMVRRNTTASAFGHPAFEASTWSGANLPSTAKGGTVINPVLFPHVTAPYGLDRFDVNGDGLQDLFVQVQIIAGMSGAPYLLTLKSRSGWFEVEPSANWVNFTARTILNFNDDACTDYIITRTITLSSCAGSSSSTITVPGSEPIRALLDWNGDKKTDVLVATGATLSVYPSTGTGFGSLTPTTISSTGTVSSLDQDGDRKADLLRTPGSGAANYFTATAAGSPPSNATNIPDLLSVITDGFGSTISVSYVSTAQSNYSTGTPPTDPWLREADPQIVVSRATFSHGTGATEYYDLTYQYTGARYDSSWRLFAGFEKISVTDSRDSTIRHTSYSQGFPSWMFPKKEERVRSNGTRISLVESEYDAPFSSATSGPLYFVYPKKITAKDYEVGGAKDGQLITTRMVENLNPVAAYGNIGQVKVTVTDEDTASPFYGQSWVTTTDKVFSVDAGAWCIDLVSQITVTKSAPSATNVVRTTSYTPDIASKCRFTEEIVEPLSDAYRIRTIYGYDSFGNVNLMDIYGRKPAPGGGHMDMALRRTTVGWDAYGIFPISEINPEFHSTSRTHYYDKSRLKDETDANGLKTEWLYDAFGRETRMNRPDGIARQTRYVDCASISGLCGSNRRGVVYVEELDGFGAIIRESHDVVDQYGRAIESWRKTSNSASDVAHQVLYTQFDAFNRVKKRSAPCLTSYCGTLYWTDYTYDLSHRPTKVTRPTSATDPTKVEEVFTFEGRISKVTERLETESPGTGKTTTKLLDVNGWLRQLRDPGNYGANYTYDAAGSVLSVTDTQGVPLLSGVEYQYGVGAFQTKSTDANMGPWEWTYDSLGSMVAWKDAKGQLFSASFDRLSRPTGRTEPGNSIEWKWDSHGGITHYGSLIRTANTAGGQTYAEEFNYDAKGRIAKRRYVVPGAGNFDYDYTYDDSVGKTGLLNTVELPASVGTRVKLKYEYRFGELVRVRDANSSATPYWELVKVDAFSAPSEELLGNGLTTKFTNDSANGFTKAIYSGTGVNPTSARGASYTHDAFGNVTQRQEAALSLTENFYYDNLDRLSYSTLQTGGGSPVENARFGYSGNGNISSQFNGAISYDYSNQWAGCSYYGTHAQPHAVRKITASGSSLIYCYDQNGNATSRGGHSISWTSYNYPSLINGASSQSAQFSYGPQRQRWKMVYTRGSEVETTLYLGPSLERVARPNGDVLWRHTISANGAPKAILTRNNSTGVDTIRYVLAGQDGSVDAFAAANQSVIRSSFTAFGDRRDSATWSGSVSAVERDTLDAVSREGYTYQTVLGALGLNHMNGRVQDAVAGRFLSADPFVFEPLNTQGYNRYSYVYNNPITFTDPSGFRTESRTGRHCFSVHMPYTQVTIRGPTVNSDERRSYREGSPGYYRDAGVYRGPPHAPIFGFGPLVTNMQCVDFSYQVEMPDPPRDQTWWDHLKTGVDVVTDFAPVVSTIKGGYEAYKVITDPNASAVDKLVAGLGVLPGGKSAKHVKNGIDAVQDAKKAAKVAGDAARIPGRVQSRINISNQGLSDALRKHADGRANKSQFSIDAGEIKSLLGSNGVVQSPVIVLGSGQFAREVDVGRIIGNLPANSGGGATSIMTVITDSAGNLVNTFPGPLRY
jgi:RHS repeat-associated protein